MHQRPRPASRPASEASSPSLPPEEKPPTDKQVLDQIIKLNQIVQNYHTKAALIILHSRTALRPVYKDGNKRVNKWFNVEVDETDALRDDLVPWRNCTATDRRPEPLVIETFLDTSQLTNCQDLVILDDYNKRWDVLEALSNIPGSSEKRKGAKNDVVLERWFVEMGSSASGLPRDMTHILPTLYKKCIVTFRSLVAYAKFLPAWRFTKRQSKVAASPVLRLQYRILPASKCLHGSRTDTLTVPLYEGGSGDVVENYSFGVTDSPAGPLSIRVTYRVNCEFRVDDSETLLSSRFMGADDELFRPSLPVDEDSDIPNISRIQSQNVDAGSLPARHRPSKNPDYSQAYGSMSTFHRADPAVKGSPISALRAAREIVGGPPSPPPAFMPSPKLGHARLASLSNEDTHTPQRRPSVSYQPFKAPPLSASPALGAARSPSSKPVNMKIPSNQTARPNPSPRKFSNSSTRPHSAHILPEQAVFSSMSASPKQAPISRYSSSFSHRRGRLSIGGGSKTEEDNNSSGKASISSSSAAAGGQRNSTSGVFPVIDADEDNISDFLKLLDQRKDLIFNAPGSSTLDPTHNRTTTTALSRFQKMKDANTALSDSMTSSLLLHRSSNASLSSNKQLSLPTTGGHNVTTSSIPSAIPSGVSGSISSSPGKAISPHTPHTPAIPSRLSSNSVIEYPSPDEPGHIITTTTRSRRALRRDSTLDETPEPKPEPRVDTESLTTTAIAIDIPLPASPLHHHHRSGGFIPSFRRSSSAAQRRTSTTANSHNTATGDEDIPDFLPIPTTTRSISLGAQDRSPPSISELLQAASPDPENQPLPPSIDRREDEVRTQPDLDGGVDGVKGRYTSYQPRFAQPLDQNIPTHTAISAHARRSSMRRFSTTRSPWGSNHSNPHPHGSGNMDEDEPLLFTMSDFGAGASQRTTLGGNAVESRNRRRADRDRESDGGGSGSGGGNPCSFHPWD